MAATGMAGIDDEREGGSKGDAQQPSTAQRRGRSEGPQRTRALVSCPFCCGSKLAHYCMAALMREQTRAYRNHLGLTSVNLSFDCVSYPFILVCIC